MFEHNLYDTEQSKRIDQFIINQLNISSLELMSKAAFACFSEIQKQTCNKVTIVCGAGNNAGDGLMIAALCHMAGANVNTYLCCLPKQLSKDSQYMRDYAEAIGVKITVLQAVETSFIEAVTNADIIIDAIFGTGINRSVEGLFAEVIKVINSYSKNTLSVDVPSGICASTGKVFKVAVVANKTVSFICKKIGLYTGAAPDYVGNLIFSPLIHNFYHGQLGFDETSIARLVDKKDLPSYLMLPRGRTINKSNKGHLAIIAGEQGMFGAAVMTAIAALKVGAGRVSLFTHPKNGSDAITATHPEIMCHRLHSADEFLCQADKFDVIAIGCGMCFEQEWSASIVPSIFQVDKPMVIDAGALDFLGVANANKCSSPRLITPHEGEASRLLGTNAEHIRNNRIAATKQLAQKFNVSVLLKGYASLLYSNTTMYLNPYGHNILATAGSGDILTGVIAGLASSLQCLEKATLLALLLQGVAAENYAAENGIYGFVASMLLDEITAVMNNGR